MVEGRRVVFLDVDGRAGLAGCRTVYRRERSLVTQELNQPALVVHQRQPIGGAVLQAILGVGHGDYTIAVGQIGDGALKHFTGRRSRVDPAAGAVVADEAPTGQVCPGGTGNLDKFAQVDAVVVVVDLIDKNNRSIPRRLCSEGKGALPALDQTERPYDEGDECAQANPGRKTRELPHRLVPCGRPGTRQQTRDSVNVVGRSGVVCRCKEL
jgi:hypothetical protein